MFIGGYEIPRRLLALTGLLLVVAAAAVVFLVVKPFDSTTSAEEGSDGQPAAVQAPVVGQKAIEAIDGQRLTLDLKRGTLLKGYTVFATVSKEGKTMWTQRLEAGKPVGAKLEEGDFVLSLAFSPCKDDCNVFHGGVGLPPVPVKGGNNVTLTITPNCRKVSFAPGIDCSATKVNR